jgi:cell division protein ZapA (FtsZ GTPase activity inhibitor)
MPEITPQEVHKMQIGGEVFHLRSDGSSEEIEQIAGYVDFEFRKAQKAAGSGDRFRAAVLAALNIAGQLWEVKKIREDQEETLRQVQAKLDALLELSKEDQE